MTNLLLLHRALCLNNLKILYLMEIDNFTLNILQEEILFMIYPELIAGMLFLPAMMENEAVEIVGAEQFSSYSG